VPYFPAIGQEFFEAIHRVVGDPGEDVAQIGEGILAEGFAGLMSIAGLV
jgi:hypothetical protein